MVGPVYDSNQASGRSFVPLLLLSLLSLPFLGCGSLHVLQKDAAFSADKLQNGGIALAGVTRHDTPDYYADIPVANVLAEHLKEQIPGMKILSLKEVETLLGVPTRKEILEAFREPANLPPSAYELLRPLQAQTRYVLLVDILDEQAPDFGGTTAQPMTEVVRDPITGEGYLYRHGTKYTSTRGSVRYIRSIIAIFDLTERKLVYSVEGAAREGFANTVSDVDWVPRARGTGVPAPSDLFEEFGEELAAKLRKL
jgi:hypothetical protein